MTAVSLYAWDSVNNVFVKVAVDASGYLKNVLANLEKAEDVAHTSGDKGIMALAVRKDNVGSLCGAEGDYTPLLLNEHGVLRTQAQQHYHIDECEATTGWTVLGNDTINLATTTNHVCGQLALEFDKVDGAANTKIAGIQKTITSFDFTPYHKGGGFALCSFYVSSLTDVDYTFLRLGTDSSNYSEWRCSADDLEEGWNLCRYTACKPSAKVGNGWNSAAITYIAVGVAFDAETDTLADIAVDHIAANTGLLTSVPVEAAKNINLLKVKNKVVNTEAGNVGTGTQRITVADDDTNLSAIKTAIEKLKTETDWTENQSITFDDTTPAKTVEGKGSIDLAANGYKKVNVQIQIIGGANWDGNAEIRIHSSSDSGTTKDTILFYNFEVTYTASATKRVSFVLNEVAWVEIGVYNGNATAEDITISGKFCALKYKSA